MEAEKLSETITKTGDGEKNPHIIKAFFISIFAVALSFSGLGSSDELKTISADVAKKIEETGIEVVAII